MKSTLNLFVIMSIMLVIIGQFGVIAPPPRRIGGGQRQRTMTRESIQLIINQLQTIEEQNAEYSQQNHIRRIIRSLVTLQNSQQVIYQNHNVITHAKGVIERFLSSRSRQIRNLKRQIRNLTHQLANNPNFTVQAIDNLANQLDENPDMDLQTIINQQNAPNPNNPENQNQDQPPQNDDGAGDEQ